jgi:hypothetical protein
MRNTAVMWSSSVRAAASQRSISSSQILWGYETKNRRFPERVEGPFLVLAREKSKTFWETTPLPLT